MEDEIKYMRIGTSLYKVVRKPGLSGSMTKTIIQWSYGAIRQDESKEYIINIPKYDGFCIVPDNINYKRVVGNFYNKYEPINHIPTEGCNFYNKYEPINHIPTEGSFVHIDSLIHHIFEEQYELGMDYIQLLYTRPLQKLPILLLVSQERNTGKSTFLNFLKAIFQDNVTFNTNEDFGSKFNEDWATKLLVVVDEVMLNKREDTERLKNLSTALNYKVEAKQKDRHEIEFFSKFVLCSNNEAFPIIIDPEETRFWVRKIRHLESDDTDFLKKLKIEIPAFLYFLLHRQMYTRVQSRMWFSASDLRTAALERIMNSSRSRLELDMTELFNEIMDAHHIDRISFCMADFIALFEYHRIKMDKAQVKRILKDLWKVPHADNALSYSTYIIDRDNTTGYAEVRRIGRFYTISRDNISHLL